jgi:spermidine/putrescine transport system substrate-binding protein
LEPARQRWHPVRQGLQRLRRARAGDEHPLLGGLQLRQVLDPFRKKEGATVKAESLTNDPTMINRLRAGETNVWDLINVNNPWARKVMWPAKLIKPLPRDQFEPYFEKMLPDFRAPYKWAMSDDGKELLGMAQRFGPYSFVVNTDKISRNIARNRVGICSTIPSSRAATVSRNPMTGTCSTSSSSRASIRSRSIPRTR